MMNEFKTYHPIVNFIYFVFVIGFSMFFMHPLCLITALVCAFAYSVLLKGKKAFKTNFLYMLPIMAVTALLNPAFNHEGVTILSYLPGGNPLTLESIIYGLAAAMMLVSVICWFSCYNAVMTSDKFMYLFGKIIPSLSLILSMTLRFVPKFSAQLAVVISAQRCIGRDVSSGSMIKRTRHALAILSVMVTWALENSIETADSMKSRGYGLPGRTAFSLFTFNRRDTVTFTAMLILGLYILIGSLMGAMNFHYFPSMKTVQPSLFSISVFTAYMALCLLPILIEIREVIQWKAIKLKI